MYSFPKQIIMELKWYFYLLLPRQNCLFSEIIFPFWNYFFPTKHLFSRKIGGKLLIWKEVYIFFLRNGLLYNTMGFTIWTSDRCRKIALLANFRTLYEYYLGLLDIEKLIIFQPQNARQSVYNMRVMYSGQNNLGACISYVIVSACFNISFWY